MTNRELFHATMSHENGDLLLHLEQGFNVPYKTWYKEGLPEQIVGTSGTELTEKENLFDHFNVTGWLFCRFEQFCIPAHEEKILEIKDGTRKSINSSGNTIVWVDEATSNKEDGTMLGSPPHEIDFAIKTLGDYEANRFRFIGNIDKRVDAVWLRANAMAYREETDYINSLWVHGPFAYLREILGTENAIVAPYEDPELTQLMLKDHLETSKQASEKVIQECRPDCCFIWEDCCGSSGPFMSPSIFDDAFGWWYKEWKDYLSSMGVRWTVLDTDGDPSPLVRQWYESGIDCMLPWEVNGVDMLKFAQENPSRVMMGGIYKHMFEPCALSQVGRFRSSSVCQAVDEELERVMKIMKKRGGYIASLDHWANPATSYSAYKYYSDVLSRKYGKANLVHRKSKNFLKKSHALT